MKHAVVSKDLESAVKFAKTIADTDQIIVFDGAEGGINVSESLAELMTSKANEVSEEVKQVLMPKWLKQRNIVAES
jgi:hypothetical protein